MTRIKPLHILALECILRESPQTEECKSNMRI